MSNKVKLQLGDIIEIIAPNDKMFKENTLYYIEYIDANEIRLEEEGEGDGNEIILPLTNGNLYNESIENIIIKSHATEKGYARQNNLIKDTWIDIGFGGELPLTFTGKITNLEMDKIEITIFPSNEVIYIDFAYKGLPKDLPIEYIKIRRAPEVSIEEAEELDETGEGNLLLSAEGEGKVLLSAEGKVLLSAEGESQGESKEKERNLPLGLIEMPEEEMGEDDKYTNIQIQEQLKNLIYKADQIQFGEELESITRMVDVPEEEQRYDIEQQLDDLLNDMLSSIPNEKRTDVVKNNINKMIQRFKQLREQFSIFDNKGYAIMPNIQGSNYKPLIKVIEKLDKQLYWMLPVVKTVKKIFFSDEKTEEEEEDVIDIGSEDISLLTFMENFDDEKDIVERYERNDIGGENNKYEFLQKTLNNFCTPFTNPLNRENVMNTMKVNTTLMTVADNLGDFNSSINGVNTLLARKYKVTPTQGIKRFFIQTFNTGLTGLEVTKVRGDNPIITQKFITPNDTINIKSFLTLPEPTVRFSRINLYSTNILDKANLNLHFLNYWQLLKSTTSVSKTTLHDITKPYNHDENTFLKKVKHFTVAEDILELGETDLYKKFLESVIPKTNFIFNSIKPYLTGNLSLNDILNYLEPFMIYQQDLTFTQFKEMKNYLEDKILEYRQSYSRNSRDYGNLKGIQPISIPSMVKILDENPSLRAKVLDVYGFTDTIMQMTNADFVRQINEIDRGVFYNNAISLMCTKLMIAEGSKNMADINIFLNSETMNTVSNVAEKKKTAKSKVKFSEYAEGNECNKIKVIAKRYVEEDELADDNNKEIYYDKKYDTTDYNITKADSTLTFAEQIKYYMDRLIKIRGLSELNARREAEAIIKGKRIVDEGDYAILEKINENSATLQYYIRKNETWELDSSIDPETFADNASLVCNLNEKCLYVKNTCQDQTTGANEIKKQNLKLLLSEFDSNLNANKDILMNRIQDEIEKADERIEILRKLRLLDMYKYEKMKMTLANSLETMPEQIISPHEGLYNTIMGENDIAKRSLDIIKFVKSFTREGIISSGESPYWFYCNDSNKKLVPTFLYKLAVTFIDDRKNYRYMLDKICAEQGTISEDGDKWVDEKGGSGLTIQMIELNEDEEYNEAGFKIITHSMMEMDAGDIVMQNAKKNETQEKQIALRKFATPDADKIYNVIDEFCSAMNIKLDEQKDFIVRNVLKQITNPSVMPTKSDYAKLFANATAKGNPIDTYEIAYNSRLLYFTFSLLLISIQISVPPIKTKTIFPGCKKYFNGFPVEDNDDMKAVNYIACVAYKIKNPAVLPWSAIAKKNQTGISKQMEAMITRFILPNEEVKNAITSFKSYLEKNPDMSYIPNDHNVSKWTNFLPPLKPIKMAAIKDVGDVFKSQLSDSLKKNSHKQHEYISEVKSKILMFSYSIIDLIEKSLQGEQAILKNSMGEPFIENACCDKDENNTLLYFIKKQPDIAVFNNKVVRLSDILIDTTRISKAAFLYDPRNNKRKIIELNNTFSEETIYRAFIVYCKFNTLVPLGENLKAICPTKPDNFDAMDSLQESIRKLKSNARNYNENSLAQLLDVINNSNKQTIEKADKEITNVSKMSEIMEKMDKENLRDGGFRKSFMDVLESFDMNALIEDTAEIRKLKNLLHRMSENIQKEIFEFVSENNKSLKKSEQRDFKNCIETIIEFKETGDNMFLGTKEETGYKMSNFMKNTMRYMTKEFPNIIRNNINYGHNIPEHWYLSFKHSADVQGYITKHNIDLKQFYNDKQVNLLMEKLIATSADINDLAQHTLFYTPIEMLTPKPTSASASTSASTSASSSSSGSASAKPDRSYKHSAFDLDLTNLLFKFYFLNVLYDLMLLRDDADVLYVPLSNLQEDANEDERLFMAEAVEMNVLEGNKVELSQKIAKIMVIFVNMICKDKKVINYNYKALMDVILRSKVKEKDEITEYLSKLDDDENAIEKEFKMYKLGRWNKGQQKGFRIYDQKTYDEERSEMEKRALRELQNPNREINQDDMDAAEALANDIEGEDERIDYLGEDAEYEDYEMDGDENY